MEITTGHRPLVHATECSSSTGSATCLIHMPVRHPVFTPASSAQWSKVKRVGLAPSRPRSSFAMGQWKQSAFLFGGVTDRHGKKDAMYSELHNELYQFNLAACRWFPVSMRAPKGQVRTRPNDHGVSLLWCLSCLPAVCGPSWHPVAVHANACSHLDLMSLPFGPPAMGSGHDAAPQAEKPAYDCCSCTSSQDRV